MVASPEICFHLDHRFFFSKPLRRPPCRIPVGAPAPPWTTPFAFTFGDMDSIVQLRKKRYLTSQMALSNAQHNFYSKPASPAKPMQQITKND